MISQRELRNDNAEVIRAVERGESLTVTRRGVPVARIVPIGSDGDLRIVRRAKVRGRFGDIPRIAIDEPTSAILDDLRGDR